MLAQELIKLNDLHLAGKLVSEELRLGLHTSRRAGVGAEFEQYRHYLPGDDPKRIDWKLLARTDRHMVRESATESNRQIRFLLDLSGSMNYAENGVSRLNYAKIVVASLAYLGFRQGDDMSLYGLQNGVIQPLVRPGHQAFQQIVVALEKAEATGAWNPTEPTLPPFGTKTNEMLIVVSDLLQVNDEWLALVRTLAHPRREILLIQVLGNQEMDFSMAGFFRFQDLETGREVEIQAESVQQTVRERAAAYFQMLDEGLRVPNVQLTRALLNEPIALVLRRVLG
ncbi:DUF58 domain-containing protein [Rudanella paleaurantiibacter]|uniref:DUF58 domain-containing protein n=1 Tax=Rudanella paleaurantiibacter TaxID=2614655 RepID=A0A7J5TWX9_9BACT|nr:DUF58 domain-containing protein [Rudanella paleaurantiibacter]KAB7729101.1 DUF58 domain-containing protein [Rudanella paleaurantiibacter]